MALDIDYSDIRLSGPTSLFDFMPCEPHEHVDQPHAESV
jgi:hypothetical protein